VTCLGTKKKQKITPKKRQMTRKWACGGGVSYEQVGSFAYTAKEREYWGEKKEKKNSPPPIIPD
jgi:hypothetical protein